LPITLDPDTADRAWQATTQLAERSRLSVHDAASLELAQRRRLPLASLDRDLREAASAAGVDVLGVAP
jgi:predicted nucleic acid-binding protein